VAKRIQINEEAFLKYFMTRMSNIPYMPKQSDKYIMDTRYKLWKLGFTDSEIAQEIDATREQIASWRQERNLKCNKEKSLVEKYGRRFRYMYHKGYSDQAIVDEYDVNIRTVEKWRQSKGLPPQHKLEGSVIYEAV
jgi:uncharacterized protein YjcR